MASEWDIAEELENWRLHYAAGEGDLAAVTRLLEEGRDPNTFDVIGHTPLHYAAAGEHFEIAKALLANGARVNACDNSCCGNTVLAHVAQTCSLAMAQFLVDAGADPTIPGHMRITAIQRAQSRKRGDGNAVYELLCRVAGR